MLKFPVSLLTRTNVGEFLDKIVFRINYKWEEVICILLFYTLRAGEVFSLGVPCRERSFLLPAILNGIYRRAAAAMPFRVFDD